MTSNITIGRYGNIKPVSVEWKCGVSSFTDTCTISLPLQRYIKSTSITTDNIIREEAKYLDTQIKNTSGFKCLFSEGDEVDVALGYGHDKSRRFKGFVCRIDYSIPLKLHCEGYSYKLKNKIFNKSYKSTTLKEILADLVEGTGIKLSEYIPNVPFKNLSFPNYMGLKVLQWFQDKCLMSVFFDFDTIYVGHSKQGIPKGTEKLKIGWNTISCDNFQKLQDSVPTRIVLTGKNNLGEKVKVHSSFNKDTGDIKEVKIGYVLTESDLKLIADELYIYKNFNGYQGNIECFLLPSFEKGMVANVIDDRFPERTGYFFVEEIAGNFSSSGGRQNVTLRYYGKLRNT